MATEELTRAKRISKAESMEAEYLYPLRDAKGDKSCYIPYLCDITFIVRALKQRSLLLPTISYGSSLPEYPRNTIRPNNNDFYNFVNLVDQAFKSTSNGIQYNIGLLNSCGLKVGSKIVTVNNFLMKGAKLPSLDPLDISDGNENKYPGMAQGLHGEDIWYFVKMSNGGFPKSDYALNYGLNHGIGEKLVLDDNGESLHGEKSHNALRGYTDDSDIVNGWTATGKGVAAGKAFRDIHIRSIFYDLMNRGKILFLSGDTFNPLIPSSSGNVEIRYESRSKSFAEYYNREEDPIEEEYYTSGWRTGYKFHANTTRAIHITASVRYIDTESGRKKIEEKHYTSYYKYDDTNCFLRIPSELLYCNKDKSAPSLESIQLVILYKVTVEENFTEGSRTKEYMVPNIVVFADFENMRLNFWAEEYGVPKEVFSAIGLPSDGEGWMKYCRANCVGDNTWYNVAIDVSIQGYFGIAKLNIDTALEDVAPNWWASYPKSAYKQVDSSGR